MCKTQLILAACESFLSLSRSCLGRLSASTSSPLPAPTLYIYSRSKGSVVLACRTPEGHRGDNFTLFRYRDQMDSREPVTGAEEVHFIVTVTEDDPVQLFCCLYKDQGHTFSPFSQYLRLDAPTDAAPTRSVPSVPSVPPPVLSVNPSTGVVKRGDMLSFRCSAPLPSQSQSQQSNRNKPVTFLLLRAAEPTGSASVTHQPRASRLSNPEPQPGVFSVGPVRGGEEGEYTCIYQITKRKALVNSTVSNVVQITITDALPVPSLVLQQQTDVWHLLCTGSPAYPGAVFSLYLADYELPVATQHAVMINHHVTIPVPVQDTPVALYQCQYDVLLGGKWSKSERSLPLAVTKVKAAAEEKKKRADTQTYKLHLGGMGQSGHNSGDSLQIAAMELALHIHDSHPPNPLDPSLFSLARPVCLYFSLSM
ncbi:hypothetical protein EYF80_006209 [Liparis tanakae]|uniref:Ig-like domain-containing protein n=1 Tax=Liparis tanakae TaxID=230148 RepID=A0A4Z2J165_9TELE|nr:hypothetical protein EYF80_006209 [Liparis tanakae]